MRAEVKKLAQGVYRDALNAARRRLPMVGVDKDYLFEGLNGLARLLDLFEGRRQLVVYHFMFDPSWDAGCASCSFIAGGFDACLPHLAARDTALVAISRAPLEKLQAFRERMGWTFPWFSSHGSEFNYDFRVTFRPDEMASGDLDYNYERRRWPSSEAPGASVFFREGSEILHSYSTYTRGLDPLMASYHLLDLTPLGRSEEGLSF